MSKFLNKKLIVANWKMNPLSVQDAEALAKAEDQDFKNLEIVICPPFVYLLNTKYKIQNTKLGGQDCYFEKQGAFTGRISPWMLKGIGVEYVIVGHSERKEPDEIVAKKIKSCRQAGLKPILCVENESQLKNRLKDIKQIKNLIIAYEPTWAIGTGKACLPEKARSMAILIRRILTEMYCRPLAEKVKILYGGSVTEKNAALYALDGLLIGDSSLNPKKFIKICQNVNQSLGE